MSHICRDCGSEIRVKVVYVNGLMKRRYLNLDGTTHIDVFDPAAQLS